MYRVITDSRKEDFVNLNQVYGFLIGLFEEYREHYPSVKFFKRWYKSRCKRGVGQEPYILMNNRFFRIEKLTPSPQQAPLNEK